MVVGRGEKNLFHYLYDPGYELLIIGRGDSEGEMKSTNITWDRRDERK